MVVGAHAQCAAIIESCTSETERKRNATPTQATAKQLYAIGQNNAAGVTLSCTWTCHIAEAGVCAKLCRYIKNFTALSTGSAEWRRCAETCKAHNQAASCNKSRLAST